MSLDQKITNALINTSITNLKKYGRSRLQDLRMNTDLDHDGRSDFDQAIEQLESLSNGLQSFARSIDFDKLGSGLEKLAGAMSELSVCVQSEEAKTSLGQCRQSSSELLRLVGLALAEYRSADSKNPN